jgi:hypothetical protein
MKHHKYRDLRRLRGKNLAPNIAEAAMPMKYAVYTGKFSPFTIVLNIALVNVNHTKLLSTRRMDGVVSPKAVFSLSFLNEII